MGNGLVLSIFPGIDLLGRAFEEAGYTVVRGPDPLWGGDIHTFHPPAGVFEGVIGGPPCKGESTLAHLNGRPGLTMRDEFRRVVSETHPAWWVMEAVQRHADIDPHAVCLSPRWLGEMQSRRRYFHSNLRLAACVDVALFEHPTFKHAVLAGHGARPGRTVRRMTKYEWSEACQLQGLPADFDLPGFTSHGRYEAVGNGVPLPMGRAIAQAVQRAMSATEEAV